MFRPMLPILASLVIAQAQAPSAAIIANLETAAWTHEKGDPAGIEGVTLRTDPGTGGLDLLVHLPPGHVVAPHWHESNERIHVAEGQLKLHQESGDVFIKPGGFAFLPAREVQRMTCDSKARCTFYLSWDGNPKSHRQP